MDGLTNIRALIEPLLAAENLQLYEIGWRQEGSTRILQVAIMHSDGSMDIDTCADMSEKIGDCLDAADIIANEYFLEVCSPGAERELKGAVQIKEALHEYIYVKLKDPKAGMNEVKGYLKAFEETTITVEYMDKAVKKKMTIEMDNISLIRLSVKI